VILLMTTGKAISATYDQAGADSDDTIAPAPSFGDSRRRATTGKPAADHFRLHVFRAFLAESGSAVRKRTDRVPPIN
jgi:hypothetical protein